MGLGAYIYKARRRLQFGFRHWIAERYILEKVEEWESNHSLELAPVPVHFLVSRYDWRMALWMLVSLHETSSLRWSLILHEDGSLEESQFDIFATLFPGVKVIRRTEADLLMKERLADYPRCAEYRSRMPHGLKSFDIPQMAEASRFLMIDPDVMFFDRPGEILNWVGNSDDRSCWFNQDFQEPSPIPPEQAEGELGVTLWPRINTGLCMLTRNSVNRLDAMEEWLGHPALQDPKVQWRVEQTLLALSASKAGKGGLLPSTYEVSPNKHRQSDSIARHYVGCVRDRFVGEGVFQNAKLLKR